MLVMVLVWVAAVFVDVSPLLAWPKEQMMWWQPFTYWAVHIGVLHLASNLGAIVAMQGGLKKAYGSADVFMLFFLSASLAAILPIYDAPMAGASAGIGALIVVYFLTYSYKKILVYPLLSWLKALVVVQTIAALIWPNQSVHLVGMLCGLFYMMYKKPRLFQKA